MIALFFLNTVTGLGDFGVDDPPVLTGAVSAEGWWPLGGVGWVTEAWFNSKCFGHVEFIAEEVENLLVESGWAEGWAGQPERPAIAQWVRDNGAPVLVVAVDDFWLARLHAFWPGLRAKLGLRDEDVVFLVPTSLPGSSRPSLPNVGVFNPAPLRAPGGTRGPQLRQLRQAALEAAGCLRKVVVLDDQGDHCRPWLPRQLRFAWADGGESCAVVFHVPGALSPAELARILERVVGGDDAVLVDHLLSTTTRGASAAEAAVKRIGSGGPGFVHLFTSTGSVLAVPPVLSGDPRFVTSLAAKPTDASALEAFRRWTWPGLVTLRRDKLRRGPTAEQIAAMVMHLGLAPVSISEAREHAARILPDPPSPLLARYLRVLGGEPVGVDVFEWANVRFCPVALPWRPSVAARVGMVSPRWWDDNEPALAFDAIWATAKWTGCAWDAQHLATNGEYSEATNAHQQLYVLGRAGSTALPRMSATDWGKVGYGAPASLSDVVIAWRAALVAFPPSAAPAPSPQLELAREAIERYSFFIGANTEASLMLGSLLLGLARKCADHFFPDPYGGHVDSFSEIVDPASVAFRSYQALWNGVRGAGARLPDFGAVARWYRDGGAWNEAERSPNDLLRLWVLAHARA